MIIEIGTSDFRTSAGIRDGLFIEPVKYYFDRLPRCRKENVAISNQEGEIDVYYMTEEDIKENNLPYWIVEGFKSTLSLEKYRRLIKYLDSAIQNVEPLDESIVDDIIFDTVGPDEKF